MEQVTSAIEVSLVHRPVFKPTVELLIQANIIRLQNGPFAVELEVPTQSEADYVRVQLATKGNTVSPLDLLDALGLDGEAGRVFINGLIERGVVIESPGHHGPWNGRYVAHRLIDHFRLRSHTIWSQNDFLGAISRCEGGPSLAVGYLLETYFVVRDAFWTAPAVLSHHLTTKQRQLLTEFFTEEGGHGELMADSFELVGLSPKEVRRGIALPSGRLYNLFHYASGNLSPSHFAVATIVPEVREDPSDVDYGVPGSRRSLMDAFVDEYSLPPELVTMFRQHEGRDEAAEHSNLVVDLLEEEGFLGIERVESLFSFLDQEIYMFDRFLNDIYTKYANSKVCIELPPTGTY